MNLNHFTLFCVLVFVCSCTTRTSNNLQENLKTENDSIQIMLKPYKNSEQVEYEIPIIRNTSIKHGLQKRYYLSGSLYSEVPYVQGKREGTASTYYQAAEGAKPKVWKEQPYKKNQLHGVCKRYHDDGTLQAEYEYKNGLPGVGLKEYTKSGKLINQPTLILTQTRVHSGYYITAELSNKAKNVDYFMGSLLEGKYLPNGLKGLQENNGVGEIVLNADSRSVTITAVFATRYRNKCVVSKSITLQ